MLNAVYYRLKRFQTPALIVLVALTALLLSLFAWQLRSNLYAGMNYNDEFDYNEVAHRIATGQYNPYIKQFRLFNHPETGDKSYFPEDRPKPAGRPNWFGWRFPMVYGMGYFMKLGRALGVENPYGETWSVAWPLFCSMASVVLLFFTGLMTAGYSAGLFMAALFAVNAWDIQFSTMAMTESVLNFFMVLSAFFTAFAVWCRNRPLQALSAFAAGFALFIPFYLKPFAVLVLLPVIFVFAVIELTVTRQRLLKPGTLGAAVLLLFFLAGPLARAAGGQAEQINVFSLALILLTIYFGGRLLMNSPLTFRDLFRRLHPRVLSSLPARLKQRPGQFAAAFRRLPEAVKATIPTLAVRLKQSLKNPANVLPRSSNTVEQPLSARLARLPGKSNHGTVIGVSAALVSLAVLSLFGLKSAMVIFLLMFFGLKVFRPSEGRKNIELGLYIALFISLFVRLTVWMSGAVPDFNEGFILPQIDYRLYDRFKIRITDLDPNALRLFSDRLLNAAPSLAVTAGMGVTFLLALAGSFRLAALLFGVAACFIMVEVTSYGYSGEWLAYLKMQKFILYTDAAPPIGAFFNPELSSKTLVEHFQYYTTELVQSPHAAPWFFLSLVGLGAWTTSRRHNIFFLYTLLNLCFFLLFMEMGVTGLGDLKLLFKEPRYLSILVPWFCISAGLFIGRFTGAGGTALTLAVLVFFTWRLSSL